MKTKSFFLPTVMFCALAATPLLARDITFAQCPGAVQEAVRTQLNGGRADDVDLVTVNGLTMYVVDIEFPPSKRERKLYLNESGTILKTREDVALSDVPAPVKDAARELAGAHGKIDDVDRETADGKVTYRVDIDREDVHGGDLKAVFGEDGKMLSQSAD